MTRQVRHERLSPAAQYLCLNNETRHCCGNGESFFRRCGRAIPSNHPPRAFQPSGTTGFCPRRTALRGLYSTGQAGTSEQLRRSGIHSCDRTTNKLCVAGDQRLPVPWTGVTWKTQFAQPCVTQCIAEDLSRAICHLFKIKSVVRAGCCAPAFRKGIADRFRGGGPDP